MDEHDEHDESVAGDGGAGPDEPTGDGVRFEERVPVRYRDLDPFGHVNNAVTVTYLETARVAYLREVVGFDLADPDDRLVVAGLELSYEAPITLEDDAATVAVRVPSLGRSSFGMRYRLSAGGTVAATAETTQVAVTEAGDARPLPDRWREAVAAYEGIDEGPR